MFAAKIGEDRESAVGGETAQISAGGLPVNLRYSLFLMVLLIRVYVCREKRSLMLANSSFRCADDLGAHEFSLAFQIGQHLPGCGFISASRSRFTDDTGPVAVLGDEKRRFKGQAIRAVLPHGEPC